MMEVKGTMASCMFVCGCGRRSWGCSDGDNVHIVTFDCEFLLSRHRTILAVE